MRVPRDALSLTLGAVLAANAGLASAAPTEVETLWAVIQKQQARIEKLEARLETIGARAQAADEKVEAAGSQIEQLRQSRSTASSWAERTTLGGYGELHYNNLDAEDPDRDLDEIDLHRFVLSLGHRFSERIRFFSELEVEHGGVEADGDPLDGEVELEQAFVELDVDDRHAARGGVFLIPAGILNETHEPVSFYGVERNDVENVILPTTWWAGGAALNGRYANGLSWDLAIHSGLEIPVAGGSAFRIRSGRQKISQATARDLAYTVRTKYTGIPGLELAATAQHQTDASQAPGDGLEEANLFTAHGIWARGPFMLKALYAGWWLDGAAAEQQDDDRQYGWYVEPSFKPRPDLGLYARYEKVEGARDRDEFNQWEAGLNYWPHEDVVLKLDYRDRSHDVLAERGRDFEGFDLGIGYQF